MSLNGFTRPLRFLSVPGVPERFLPRTNPAKKVHHFGKSDSAGLGLILGDLSAKHQDFRFIRLHYRKQS